MRVFLLVLAIVAAMFPGAKGPGRCAIRIEYRPPGALSARLIGQVKPVQPAIRDDLRSAEACGGNGIAERLNGAADGCRPGLWLWLILARVLVEVDHAPGLPYGVTLRDVGHG